MIWEILSEICTGIGSAAINAYALISGFFAEVLVYQKPLVCCLSLFALWLLNTPKKRKKY